MKVKLISRTSGVGDLEGRSIDDIILYNARISSPKDVEEKFKSPEGLLRHCALNQHWSIYDTCNLGFEIETSRDIGRQLIRHSSIHPQEFSQRYEKAIGIEDIELRAQCDNNRQSSSEVFDPEITSPYYPNFKEGSLEVIKYCFLQTEMLYDKLLEAGVARECARGILPGATTSKLNMNGTIRSWITFLNARLHDTAQKEARDIAEAIKNAFIEQCPIIAKTFFNFETHGNIHVLERIVLEKYGVYNKIIENENK